MRWRGRKAIIDANPGVPTVVSTHTLNWHDRGRSDLTRRGESRGEGLAGPDGLPIFTNPERSDLPADQFNTGEEIFADMIAASGQVVIAFKGHWRQCDGDAKGTGEPGGPNEDGEVLVIEHRDAGNPVYTMLANDQDNRVGEFDNALRPREFRDSDGDGNY